ncbi:hypothetical protein DI396_02100 [Litorivita pollutaquae]|uniref:Uncharacterized protein n=1 Tax=Litorivita pollutaquae TaxID=2200892 RepID=A0A2V4MQA3_9RHOB|nr:hypothetical protein DI396_02100 [Litorivita pollutaquae]
MAGHEGPLRDAEFGFPYMLWGAHRATPRPVSRLPVSGGCPAILQVSTVLSRCFLIAAGAAFPPRADEMRRVSFARYYEDLPTPGPVTAALAPAFGVLHRR